MNTYETINEDQLNEIQGGTQDNFFVG